MGEVDNILEKIKQRRLQQSERSSLYDKVRRAVDSGLATPGELAELQNVAKQLEDYGRAESQRSMDTNLLRRKKEGLTRMQGELDRGSYKREEYTYGGENTKTVKHKLGFFGRKKWKKNIDKLQGDIAELEEKLGDR